MQLQNFQVFFQPGVYMIKNIINNKRYYGQTSNIALRFAQHYRELKGNVHQTTSFQQDWGIFEAASFIWEIIEIGEQWQDSDKRLQRETELISSHEDLIYNLVRNNEKPVKTRRGMAVLVGDACYPSIAEAARFYNISVQTARRWLDTKQNNWSFFNPAQVEEQKAQATASSIAVQVGENLVFSSISEAGRFFKIHTGSVKKRIKSLNFPDWKYAGDINPEKTLIKKVTPVKVQIEGELFASFAEAARFYGIPRRTVRYRCLSQSFRFANWAVLAP
jgi:hypothetical protein